MGDRDPEFEREALQWIESITGESGKGDFEESLKDGVLLCQLVNKLAPGSVRKISKPPTMPFKQMENISKYLKAVRKFGVDEYEMFSTNDLWEGKNLKQVAYHIHALGRTCQDKADNDPNFTWPSEWPTLGIKLPKKKERHFSEAQLRRARNTPSALNMGSSKFARDAADDVLEGRISEKLKNERKQDLESKGGAVAAISEEEQKRKEAKEEWRRQNQAKKEDEVKKAEAEPLETPCHEKAEASAQEDKSEEVAPKTEAKAKPVVKNEDELPPGWKAAETEDGSVYYFNASIGKTQWEKPVKEETQSASTTSSTENAEESLPSGWRSAKTEDGKTYYFNKSTKETSWEPPKATNEATSSASRNRRVSQIKTPEEDEELAEGWRAVVTPDGATYYFNKSTRETRWDKPLRKPKVVADESLPHGWRAVLTPEGQTYYYHKETKRTQWNKPSS